MICIAQSPYISIKLSLSPISMRPYICMYVYPTSPHLALIMKVNKVYALFKDMMKKNLGS
jgi:hypothetical protein